MIPVMMYIIYLFPVGSHGIPWDGPMGSRGIPWDPMGFHETKVEFAFHGNPWDSMAPHGIPWDCARYSEGTLLFKAILVVKLLEAVIIN